MTVGALAIKIQKQDTPFLYIWLKSKVNVGIKLGMLYLDLGVFKDLPYYKEVISNQNILHQHSS